MFTPINRAEINQIVKIQLNGLIKMLKEKEIQIEYTDDLVEALANKGFDPQFGARPVKRVIQKEVLNALSKEILAGKITATSHILLDAFDDKINECYLGYMGELQKTTDKKSELFIQVNYFHSCLDDAMEFLLKTDQARGLKPHQIIRILFEKGILDDTEAKKANKIYTTCDNRI